MRHHARNRSIPQGGGGEGGAFSFSLTGTRDNANLVLAMNYDSVSKGAKVLIT